MVFDLAICQPNLFFEYYFPVWLIVRKFKTNAGLVFDLIFHEMVKRFNHYPLNFKRFKFLWSKLFQSGRGFGKNNFCSGIRLVVAIKKEALIEL